MLMWSSLIVLWKISGFRLLLLVPSVHNILALRRVLMYLSIWGWGTSRALELNWASCSQRKTGEGSNFWMQRQLDMDFSLSWLDDFQLQHLEMAYFLEPAGPWSEPVWRRMNWLRVCKWYFDFLLGFLHSLELHYSYGFEFKQLFNEIRTVFHITIQYSYLPPPVNVRHDFGFFQTLVSLNLGPTVIWGFVRVNRSVGSQLVGFESCWLIRTICHRSSRLFTPSHIRRAVSQMFLFQGMNYLGLNSFSSGSQNLVHPLKDTHHSLEL